jgi:hypothetical protein
LRRKQWASNLLEKLGSGPNSIRIAGSGTSIPTAPQNAINRETDRNFGAERTAMDASNTDKLVLAALDEQRRRLHVAPGRNQNVERHVRRAPEFENFGQSSSWAESKSKVAGSGAMLPRSRSWYDQDGEHGSETRIDAPWPRNDFEDLAQSYRAAGYPPEAELRQNRGMRGVVLSVGEGARGTVGENARSTSNTVSERFRVILECILW